MTNRAYVQKDDVNRASFQYDGHFALFRHTQEAGVHEYREENFRGTVVDSVIESKRTFETYVQMRITAYLKASVEA